MRGRLARLRADLTAAGLDAIAITHPPNVRYLTGLKASASAVVVTADECLLLVDARYVTTARQLAAVNPDLSVPGPVKSLDTSIADALQVFGGGRVGIEAAHLSVARYRRLEDQLGGSIALVATERVIEKARAIKDADEIRILREAARRLSSVARHAPELVRAGQTERETAALVEAAMRAAGFEGVAFETIVAAGPNSALPHARPTDRAVEKGDGVVLDFGGVYDGYCVDLTRTLQVGRASESFRRLFDAVAEAHAAAVAAVQPGVLPADIDKAARHVLERHGLGEAFGHGTGHGLGLEVHEEPRISSAAPAGEPVAAGMVFTIEPGAYVPGIGGVRIEDDVLVVPGGCEVLTEVPIRL